ncbi:AbrB/MazE/SpoVT family DNA-binding domain-containing protein [uncultured Methanobacterium sp.]|uniref:AbrB/MazE/SpoVT family DNA-binding domain-containing protein n=1 Tax=uncultured Methanobacterium sp. TaxID=176306 RepID=UPI002AA88A34|nr:AbrB/MazE/SpoVT family DNA-binding domain-containing protein [uncultured Methanobacterium sp.]
MVSVTKKYQVTIPKNVREDLKIQSGDNVVFVKNKEGNWVLMTVAELTDRMIESSSDISKTQAESKKGFKQRVEDNLQLLGD